MYVGLTALITSLALYLGNNCYILFPACFVIFILVSAIPGRQLGQIDFSRQAH